MGNLTVYHKSLFAGHQGVIKTYLTIRDTFFIPNLIHYLRSYIKGCHICQLSRNEKPPTRHLQTRNNPNYVPMSRLSMDLKVMPRLHKGHRYILCIIDEVTCINNLSTILEDERMRECETFIKTRREARHLKTLRRQISKFERLCQKNTGGCLKDQDGTLHVWANTEGRYKDLISNDHGTINTPTHGPNNTPAQGLDTVH